jgi:hypothetical protein
MRSMFKGRRPSPAMVLAVIALVVALAGTSMASIATISKISGKTVKKNTLPGNRVKKNTVTGKQVKESSLSTVPNSSKLGGLTADAFQPVAQWALVDGDGATLLASSSGVTVEPGSSATFTYVNFGRSVANRLIVATSARPLASGDNTVTVTPCGGAAAAPGASTCAIGDDVNHVLIRKGTTPQPFYVGVF